MSVWNFLCSSLFFAAPPSPLCLNPAPPSPQIVLPAFFQIAFGFCHWFCVASAISDVSVIVFHSWLLREYVIQQSNHSSVVFFHHRYDPTGIFMIFK